MADDSRIRVPAQLTIAGLWLMAVVYLAKAATTPVLDKGSFTPALTMLFLLLALGWLFTVVSFLTWLYLVRDTLDRRGERYLRWSRGWSIGGWFIPVANLVIPCLVVGEVYGRSVPGAFRAGRTAGIVVGWWVALILSVFRFTVTEVDSTTHTFVVHFASFWNVVNGIAQRRQSPSKPIGIMGEACHILLTARRHGDYRDVHESEHAPHPAPLRRFPPGVQQHLLSPPAP